MPPKSFLARSGALLLVCTPLAATNARAEVRLAEFMASNTRTLADEDGEFSDWIELVNEGPGTVDLAGWMLTDDAAFDPADPESVWTLPSRVLPDGGRLLVFASGKNRTPVSGELHAHFQLDAAGEALALVRPDGVTVEDSFGAGGYPAQRADISYGTGAVVLGEETFVDSGADARFLAAPTGGDWRGGAEPFNDSAWTPVTTALGFDAGTGPTGFTLFDDFETQNPGLLAGQNGWSTSSANVQVGADPASAENQVMRQTGDSVRAWKAFDIPQGDTATVFFRMRRDGIVNFGAGTSDVATPGGSFNDFETQLNNQNDAILKVRDGGVFQDVDALEDSLWYSTWMVIDNASDSYAVYWKAEGGAAARADTAGGLDVFGFRNGTASNPMRSFLARTGSGTTGTWLIDDIFLAPGENLADPAGAGSGLADFISPGGDVEAAMHGVSASGALRIPFATAELPPLSSLTLRVRHDDGFVAWLNGVEIARRNAPVVLGPDAVATDARGLAEVLAWEEIDVTAHAGALVSGGTNVLAILGLNVAAGDGDFLLDAELVGIASEAAPQLLYFTAPTPGAPSGGGVLGFVEDTRFSADRGFYATPVAVTVSTATPGATVIYTTDGSLPTSANGTAAPAGSVELVLRETTVLRAAAFRDGYLPTNVDTHSYIFPADAAAQDNAPPGYPATWKGDGGSGSFPADYEMDPEVVNDPQYAGLIEQALLSVPTISIVTDRANLFNPATGIYQNPQQSGPAWERPVSFEILEPDGSPGVQVDAGLRMQGGHTRLPSKNPKHSFRVNFRSEYGDAKLRHDLFREFPGAAREFDQIVLRGAGNQSWLHHNNFLGDNRGRAQYLRDQWAKDTQLAMGNPAVRNTYAHVYLNGLYWGLYNPTERPNADFGESYLGGDETDYEALNSGEAVDGAAALQSYNQLVAAAEAGLTGDASYAAFANLVDLPGFSDYMLLMQYGANLDWDDHNWYCLRNRDGGKWLFFAWDSEFMFIGTGDNVLGVDRASKPTRLWNRLMANAAYRRLFADRVHRHCFNGGVLTPAAVRSRWDARKEQVYDALVAESARWGDYRRDVHPVGGPSPIPLYDRNGEWQIEYERLTTTYIPARTDNLIAQYRARGWYPDTDAPVFAPHGGPVPVGHALAMGPGEVWFTTDGSEPDGSPAARLYLGPLTLDASATIKARRVENGEWSALTEATFLVGTLASAANLGLAEIMYNPAGDDASEFLELVNLSPSERIDLTGVAFAAGLDFAFPQGLTLEPGERVVLVRDEAAFRALHGEGPRVAGVFGPASALDNGGETLTLVAADGSEIFSVHYLDGGEWPALADGGGRSLVDRGTGEPGDAGSWRISTADGGNPGAGDSAVLVGPPLDDIDADGRVTLLEHFHGGSDSDPADAGSGLTLTRGVGGDVLLTVLRQIAADDLAFEFQVWDGGSWGGRNADFTLLSMEPAAPGVVAETYRFLGSEARALLRLAVSTR